MESLLVSLTQSKQDLADISRLNEENLRSGLHPDVAKEQGFVTWRYEIDLLESMQAIAPHVICRSEGQLAGYALTALKEMAPVHRELALLLPQLDALEYKGSPLHSYSYYVMGQLCVAKPFRGRGVVEKMYEMHRKTFSKIYTQMVLTISTKNTRSIRVHERFGFEEIHHFADHHGGWNVYVWDWTEKG